MRELIELYSTHAPQLVIVDIYMPGDVFGAISQLRMQNQSLKILVFTASDRVDHAINALESGANGYLLKGSTLEELIGAVSTVLKGETFVTPSLSGKIISSLSSKKPEAEQVKLSSREEQIIRLLMRGLTNKEIALILAIGEKTVKHYMTILMQKMNARNRVEVVIAAQQIGEYRNSKSLQVN